MLQYLQQRPTFSIAILIILYAVGVLAVQFAIHEDFLLLTPFNLLISLGLALLYHRHWTQQSALILLLCFIVGFTVEVIGVNTGLIFGDYSYGRVLGWKLFDTPLMIGVNWVMLVYCSAMTINQLFPKLPNVLKAILGAAIMLLLDYFIEPIAITHDFWTWAATEIPLQNYVAWYIISFGLLWLFHISHQNLQNKVAVALLILQFAFFILLAI